MDDYIRAWNAFLGGIAVEKFEDIQSAADEMVFLTSPESPLPYLFESIWEGRKLRISQDKSYNNIPYDPKWVEAVLNDLFTLGQAFQTFAKSGVRGNQILPAMEGGKLNEFLKVFSEASNGVTKNLRAVHRELRSKVSNVFRRVILSCRDALAGETQKEVDRYWERKVYEPFRKELAGRFPLDPAAMREIPLDTFSRFFNPQSGIFWSRQGDLKKLARDFVVEGKALINFSFEFNLAVEKATAIRDALYPGDSETVRVPFKLKLKRGEGVLGFVISLGEETIDFYQKHDHTGTLTWTQENSRGAKLEIQINPGGRKKWELLKGTEGEWGILRIFRKGSLRGRTSKKFTCEWDITITEPRRLGYRVQADLEAEKAANPFKKNLFRDFKCPKKVGP